MAASPFTPPSQRATKTIQDSSNDIPRSVQNDGLKSEPVQTLQTIQKAALERPASARSRASLPGTYYLKADGERGKHVVRYVYANITDTNNTSLPLHVRERFTEIENNRLRGYQQAANHRGTDPNRQHRAAIHSYFGNEIPRLTSASYESRFPQSASCGPVRTSSKYETDIAKQPDPTKASQKSTVKHAQQTRSSNAVLSPKRGSRSRSKTGSPRPRRPFSIAADSTSDTEPIENQRSVESVPPSSPPRTTGNRSVRQQQYLATKFKLAARNSKYTQTFVAAGLNVGESSGSATTVISRHHSTTQTEISGKNTLQPTCGQPNCQVSNTSAQEDISVKGTTDDAEKYPVAPQNAARSEANLSTSVEKNKENIEWKRAKVRLRSTPRGRSPPSQGSRHCVFPADWVRQVPHEKQSCLTGGRAASGHSGLAARSQPIPQEGNPKEGSPKPQATDKRFTASFTQIDEISTTSIGVQVKLKKRSSSHRRVGKERRSPSERSIASKMSLHGGNKPKEDSAKPKKSKKKKKGKNARSREPSIRSLRSLQSFQSDPSIGILKHIKIGASSSSQARSRSVRSTLTTALVGPKKKRTKIKAKKKQTSSKIARFLRTLSKDKETINVINNMAVLHKKKQNK